MESPFFQWYTQAPVYLVRVGVGACGDAEGTLPRHGPAAYNFKQAPCAEVYKQLFTLPRESREMGGLQADCGACLTMLCPLTFSLSLCLQRETVMDCPALEGVRALTW